MGSAQLGPSLELLLASAPLLAFFAYVIGGFALYLLRAHGSPSYRDVSIAAKSSAGLAGGPLHLFFAWMMRPLVSLLIRLDVTPNAITWFSVSLAVPSGIAIALGHFGLGGWLYVVAGVCDFLDGSVARKSGRVTPGGAVLDSVFDRYTETAILVALAWFYRDRWALAAVLAALTGSMFVPYVRARGEAIGAKMSDVGFMQRPERIFLLAVTLCLSPIVEAWLDPGSAHPLHRTVVAGLVVLAVGTHLTAVTRTRHLVQALGRPVALPPAPRREPVTSLPATIRSVDVPARPSAESLPGYR